MATPGSQRAMDTDRTSPLAAGQEQPLFYVTRKSQETDAPKHRKLSYVGIRNLSDLEKIQEEDIIGPKGTIRGVKNRVRAGLANFENPSAIGKVRTYVRSVYYVHVHVRCCACGKGEGLGRLGHCRSVVFPRYVEAQGNFAW